MTWQPLQPRACMFSASQAVSGRSADPCFLPGQQDIAGFLQGGQQDCQLDVVPCMGAPPIDLVGKVPVLEFAVRSLNGGSRLVSRRFGLVHRWCGYTAAGPLVDDRLPPDHVGVGIDVGVEIPLVHEGVQEIRALEGRLHQRHCNLAVMDAGPGHGVGDRHAVVVGRQMGLVPYEPLPLALRVLLCGQRAPHLKPGKGLLGIFR